MGKCCSANKPQKLQKEPKPKIEVKENETNTKEIKETALVTDIKDAAHADFVEADLEKKSEEKVKIKTIEEDEKQRVIIIEVEREDVIHKKMEEDEKREMIEKEERQRRENIDYSNRDDLVNCHKAYPLSNIEIEVQDLDF